MIRSIEATTLKHNIINSNKESRSNIVTNKLTVLSLLINALNPSTIISGVEKRSVPKCERAVVRPAFPNVKGTKNTKNANAEKIIV
jgi:hypothetical protein